MTTGDSVGLSGPTHDYSGLCGAVSPTHHDYSGLCGAVESNTS